MPCRRNRCAFGSYGGVFYDRVEWLSSTTMSESLLLEYAVSHELGHLLLGVGPHARVGIMKSEWHKKELMEAAQGTLMFRSEDRFQIGANLRRRMARQQESMNTSTFNAGRLLKSPGPLSAHDLNRLTKAGFTPLQTSRQRPSIRRAFWP